MRSSRHPGGGRPGGGVGKIFHLGKLPVSTRIGACCRVARPDSAATRRRRVQVRLMFPK